MAKLCWKKSTRSGCWSLVNQLDSSIPTQIFPNWPTSVSPILVMTRPERPTMHWQSPKPLRCQDQIMSKLQGMSALIYRPRYSLISFVFTTKNKTEITQSSSRFTMLQKLSKCEVEAWLCWNLIILPPLGFYVKSNFGEFKRFKTVIFGNFSDWILKFW